MNVAWHTESSKAVWCDDGLCQIYQDTQANWPMLLYLNLEVQIKEKLCKSTCTLNFDKNLEDKCTEYLEK